MVMRYSSGSPWEPRIGFSRAVRSGDRVLISGTAPVQPEGGCADEIEAQARRCWEIVAEALQALGARTDDVVRTRTYLIDAADAEAAGRIHGEVFGQVLPASTMVVVAGLLDPRWRIEVEAEALVGGPSTMFEAPDELEA